MIYAVVEVTLGFSYGIESVSGWGSSGSRFERRKSRGIDGRKTTSNAQAHGSF